MKTTPDGSSMQSDQTTAPYFAISSTALGIYGPAGASTKLSFWGCNEYLGDTTNWVIAQYDKQTLASQMYVVPQSVGGLVSAAIGTDDNRVYLSGYDDTNAADFSMYLLSQRGTPGENKFFNRYNRHATGLVLWLDMFDKDSNVSDTTWADISGFGSDATEATDYPARVFTTGKSGGTATIPARYFDGGDFLTVADASQFTIGSKGYTIEAWVKFDGSDAGNIIEKISGANYEWKVEVEADDDVGFTIYKATSGNYIQYLGSVGVDSDVFHHLAFVVDGGLTDDDISITSDSVVFDDLTPDNDGTVDLPLTDTTAPVLIGNGLAGHIAILRVWSGARSLDDLRAYDIADRALFGY
jgi:hypothetical protein